MTYRQRLCRHPGLSYAIFFTALGAIAGIERGGLRGAIGGALLLALLVWPPVLITARKGEGE